MHLTLSRTGCYLGPQQGRHRRLCSSGPLSGAAGRQGAGDRSGPEPICREPRLFRHPEGGTGGRLWFAGGAAGADAPCTQGEAPFQKELDMKTQVFDTDMAEIELHACQSNSQAARSQKVRARGLVLKILEMLISVVGGCLQ
jgi:hypothetical protein